MSDDPAEDPPTPFPEPAGAAARPWWEQRAQELAAALEAAVAAGKDAAEFDGRQVPVQWLIRSAEQAAAMIDRLDAQSAEGS
jgi:hypothetical protein